MDLIPVAARRMPIMREGKRVMVEPGDPVPEAAAWSHVKAWERQGYIRWVPAPPALQAKLEDDSSQNGGETADPGDADSSDQSPSSPESAVSANINTAGSVEADKPARKKRGKRKATTATEAEE